MKDNFNRVLYYGLYNQSISVANKIVKKNCNIKKIYKSFKKNVPKNYGYFVKQN